MNFWVSPYEPHAIVFSALQNGLQQTLFLPVGATRVKLLKVIPGTINVALTFSQMNVTIIPLILSLGIENEICYSCSMDITEFNCMRNGRR